MIAVTCVWMGSAYALSIEPTQEDSLLAQMITRELERRHLASDALFAERKPMVGQLILKAIDPSRSLLTQDDIRQADIDRLPDQIERGRLNTVYQLYGLSLTRPEERLVYLLDILNQGVGSIDLSDQEELRIRDEETHGSAISHRLRTYGGNSWKTKPLVYYSPTALRTKHTKH